MAVVVGAIVVGAVVSIMGNNAAAQAQQDAINRQAYADRVSMLDQQYNIEFAREFTAVQQESDELQADINFAEAFGERLKNYNLVYDNQNISLGYQGRTVSSIQNVRQADEMAWEYDNKIATLQLETDKAMMNISYAQKTLDAVNGLNSLDAGLSSLASAQDAGIAASQTGNMWSNLGAVAGAGTSMATYSARTSTSTTNSANTNTGTK